MRDLESYALYPDEADVLWFFGGMSTILVSAADSHAGLCLVHQLLPGGMATPLHVQPDDEETFHVLDGVVRFWADQRIYLAHRGATVHVPAGTPHAFRVESATAEMLDITTAGHEAFLRAIGELAPVPLRPEPDDPGTARLVAAFEEHGVEILGPPPE